MGRWVGSELFGLVDWLVSEMVDWLVGWLIG